MWERSSPHGPRSPKSYLDLDWADNGVELQNPRDHASATDVGERENAELDRFREALAVCFFSRYPPYKTMHTDNARRNKRLYSQELARLLLMRRQLRGCGIHRIPGDNWIVATRVSILLWECGIQNGVCFHIR